LGRVRKSIHEKFLFHVQTTSINRRSQILYAEKRRSITFIHTTVEYNKKNSVEDVSDERVVDAFASGLCRSDLVEELGRTKPKMVSKLMEIANRFVDGEDAYHSKRARSPENDRPGRQRNQRCRSRNKDGRARRNQITAGYKKRDEEGDENEEYQKKTTTDERGQSIPTHQQRTSFMDLAASTMHI
jgi:hypothetical protein